MCERRRGHPVAHLLPRIDGRALTKRSFITPVTTGCGPRLFCPAAHMRRDEMAGWVLLAKEGGDYVGASCDYTQLFVDVPRGHAY